MSNNKNYKRFEDLPRDNPFTVPENYFENFQKQLMDKIEDEKQSEHKGLKIRLFKNIFNSGFALAASIIAFAFISYFTLRFILGNHETVSDTFHYSELVMDDIQNYDMDLLLETYEGETTDKSGAGNNFEEEIIDYLVSEDIDYKTIFEEL